MNRNLSADGSRHTDDFRLNNFLRAAVGLGDHAGFANLAAGRVRNASCSRFLLHRAGGVRNSLDDVFTSPRAGGVRNSFDDVFAGP